MDIYIREREIKERSREIREIRERAQVIESARGRDQRSARDLREIERDLIYQCGYQLIWFHL